MVGKEAVEARATDQAPADATTAYLAPLAAILATAIVTGAFSSGVDAGYPLRVVAAGAVLAACWPSRVSRRVVRDRSWGTAAIGAAVFAL